MNRFRDQSNLLGRISLYDIRSYLERLGWRRTTTRNNKWQIFRLQVDSPNPLELVLPADDHFTDTRARIDQAVFSIGQVEERPIADVCADIVGSNTDSLLIRLRVSNDATSIPIGDASKHVKAMRNLLLYSACSEIDAKPHYEQPLPNASDLLSGFEFCHTFSGSFGFEVSNTITKPEQVDDLFDAPIRRKMVERIARGVLLLENSVSREEPNVLIEAYEFALNARMCDAMADIGLDGKIAFDLGIDWASSVTPPEDVVLFKECFIGEPQINMLRFVSEQLKIVKPSFDRIVGYVVNLHCATNPGDGDAKRTVAVKVDHNLHGLIEVKMSLGPEFYLRSIDAHSKGKRLAASGQLQRKGNTWSLESISSVDVNDV